jgi:hypothetical protein
LNPPDPTRKVIVQLRSDELTTLLERIRSFETMAPREVFDTGDEPGKNYPLVDVPNQAAQTRLAELEYDDEDRRARAYRHRRGPAPGSCPGAAPSPLAVVALDPAAVAPTSPRQADRDGQWIPDQPPLPTRRHYRRARIPQGRRLP